MKIEAIRAWTKRNIVIVFLVTLCLAFGIATSDFTRTWNPADIIRTSPFFSVPNAINLTTHMAINAMLAAGLTYVIILGGIDISVGSVAALSGIVSTIIARSFPDMNIFGGIIIILGSAIVVGVVCGGFNGIMITKFGVVPMIATLAMLTIARGLSFVFSGGGSVFDVPAPFAWLGAGRFLVTENRPTGWIPIISIFVIIAVAILALLLGKTVFGRHVYAVGSNRNVAHLSGVNVKSVIIKGHIICSVAAATGGALNASQLQNGQPAAMDGFEMFAIAAVVLGGTSLAGGVGSVGKAMVGVAIIAIINNGMNLLHVVSYWQRIVIGVIILMAVILDMSQKRKKL